ncbi:B12-binding domain-containing radical SAM protein [Wukongibacter sp. M2B1]|uniref:B12-binding domain-containing radical SAM protein n=1 Tax=Wukongibacter sp. M2B1 TaxID=3088895 RepID=UPI003D78D727
MRAIFFNSNNQGFHNSLPLGLLIISSYLEEKHHIKCEILDLPMDNDEVKKAIGNLNNNNLLFVGFSTMCNTFPKTLYLASQIKKKFNNIPIVFGGPQASMLPRQIIEHYNFVDIIVVGEAENLLDKLILSIKASRAIESIGLIYNPHFGINQIKNNNPQIVNTADMDLLPEINYNIYPNINDIDEFEIETGRGCPYKCTYCSATKFYQNNYRLKSINKLVSEIINITKQYNTKVFSLMHDNFTYDKRYIKKFCNSLIDSNLNIEWACSTRADCVDKNILELMFRAGCKNIFFGIESGSDYIQKIIQKNLVIKDAIEMINYANLIGIKPTVSFIVGFPQERSEDLIKTINLFLIFRSTRPRFKGIQIHMLSPMSKTELTNKYFSEIKYDGFLSDFSSVRNLTEWEEKEIKNFPEIFSSYYYFPNKNISRQTYILLYWILFYSNRFDNFFRLYYLTLEEGAACLLFDWFSKISIHIKDTSHIKIDESTVPLVADYLKNFVESNLSDNEIKFKLLDVIKFDLWLNYYCRVDNTECFLSKYNYTAEDSEDYLLSLKQDEGLYAYYFNPQNNELKSIKLFLTESNSNNKKRAKIF